MGIRLFHIALVLLALPPAIAPADAQPGPVPESSGQWVTDLGGFFTPAERSTLNQKLSAYEDTTSTQIVVVTVPALDGWTASEMAIEIGQQWGVGQEGQDNGVVILLSQDEREVFIATGFGLEGAIPDIVAGQIIRNIIVPEFRNGRFYGGVSSAVDALIQAAVGEYTSAEQPQRADDGPVNVATVFVLMIIVFFFLNGMRNGRRGGGIQGGRRYRRRSGIPPVIIFGGGGRGGFGGGGFGGGGFGGGGFGGGGGGFGGGGAGGRW